MTLPRNIYCPRPGEMEGLAFGLVYGFRQYQFPAAVPVQDPKKSAEAIAAGWMMATIALADRSQLFLPDFPSPSWH